MEESGRSWHGTRGSKRKERTCLRGGVLAAATHCPWASHTQSEDGFLSSGDGFLKLGIRECVPLSPGHTANNQHANWSRDLLDFADRLSPKAGPRTFFFLILIGVTKAPTLTIQPKHLSPGGQDLVGPPKCISLSCSYSFLGGHRGCPVSPSLALSGQNA